MNRDSKYSRNINRKHVNLLKTDLHTSISPKCKGPPESAKKLNIHLVTKKLNF